MFPTHMAEIIKKFYVITGIPISAYTADLKLVAQEGLSFREEKILKEHPIKKLFKKIKYEDKEAKILLASKLYLTRISINSNNSKGYYLIGPMACSREMWPWARYLPCSLVPNIVELIRSIEKNYSIKEIQKNQSYSFHVNKADQYISANYWKKITLDDVANYLDIDKCYFCSLYKKEKGKSFIQALNELRIEKSKSMLLEEDASIMDIALAVGFSNQNYFNSVFKNITGQTPTQYRNRPVDDD